ncbi:hypothetical protein LBMAG53_25100 [Planctomycetota bacterium]|nr:hypothetical protein LBMAG53_25100 [Planctomycetota bacterium]
MGGGGGSVLRLPGFPQPQPLPQTPVLSNWHEREVVLGLRPEHLSPAWPGEAPTASLTITLIQTWATTNTSTWPCPGWRRPW